MRPRQNGWHFPDDIIKSIFSWMEIWISIKISLKFVPKGSINNTPSLVQTMAWRRPGDKPLPEPMMAQFTGAYASLGLSVLMVCCVSFWVVFAACLIVGLDFKRPCFARVLGVHVTSHYYWWYLGLLIILMCTLKSSSFISIYSVELKLQ